MAEDSGSKKITITVKTPKDKKSVEIGEDAEIKEVFLFYVHVMCNSLEKNMTCFVNLMKT